LIPVMRKFKKFILGYPLVSWVLLFVLTPLVISLSLFQGYVFPRIIRFTEPLSQSIGEEVSQKTTEQSIPMQKRIADLWLEKSVQATEYYACGFNRNKVDINGIRIELPYEKDQEVGAMDFKFDSESKDSLYIKVNGWNCKMLSINKDIEIAFVTASFRLPKEIPVMLLSAREQDGVTGVASAVMHSENSFIILFPSYKDLLISFLTIAIAWWVLVFAFAKSLSVLPTTKV